jgi:succinyl-CoA synthetase alpha subunit
VLTCEPVRSFSASSRKTTEVLIPVYQDLKQAIAKHPEVDVVVNFSSFRSVYESTQDILSYAQIRTVAIIAEGVPERQTRALIDQARSKKVTIIGPATVGGIKPGCFRIGNTGGMLDNIIASKLYRPGSVAYVARSGGMSNELNNIIASNTDGVYEGIAIGGDRYPGTTFVDHLLRYEANPDVKILIVLGEVGGIEEYEICHLIKSGKITKPMVAWCIGTCAKIFPYEVQFGHAGACFLSSTPVKHHGTSSPVAHGALRVGELLTGEDGEPVQITQVENRTSEVMFEITHEAGKHVVTPGHLVTVYWRQQPSVTLRSATETSKSIRVTWSERSTAGVIRNVTYTVYKAGAPREKVAESDSTLEAAAEASDDSETVIQKYRTLPSVLFEHIEEFGRYLLAQRESVLQLGDMFELSIEDLMKMSARSLARYVGLPLAAQVLPKTANDDGLAGVDDVSGDIGEESSSSHEESKSSSAGPYAHTSR